MLETFSMSDTGCVRPNNEDYCQVIPEIGLFLLADGMGGARGGETASRLAVETIADRMFAAPQRDASTLLKAVEESNARVLEQANRDVRLEGMGTTIVAALHTGTEENTEEIAIASVGDSRAYLQDDTGLRAITQDQTWVHEVGKPLGLDEESLRTHPMRHVLTMAIGVGSALTIKYYMVALKPGATLLLSSDGLHGVIRPEQIEQILKDHDASLEQKCRGLIDAARAAGGPDNISCVLIRATTA
jgi:protein phosphatase